MATIKLVGIVNVTPDSFSDGGKFFDPQDAIKQTQQLFDNGASMVDIGAESTRPGATPVSADEEWRRLFPVLNDKVPFYYDAISVDTYRPETIARIGREIGQVTINDVTAFNNPGMVAVAAGLGWTCVVSHLPKKFGQDIQSAHHAKDKVDSVQQVVDELVAQREQLRAAGVTGKIILDPGIGFGKTLRLNWQLLDFASYVPDSDVMIGYSNKSFLTSDPETGKQPSNAQVLRQNPGWVREQNLAAGSRVITAAAHDQTVYLRVHDVVAHQTLTG